MLAEIFGPDLLVVCFVAIAFFVVPVWAVVDAATKPSQAFAAAGSSKTTWILLVVLFTLLLGVVGFGLAVIYLAVIRPKVARFV